MKRTGKELLELRKKAKLMFLQGGMTYKEIAETLGVQAKTIGKWARCDNWKGIANEIVNDGIYCNSLIDFLDYVSLVFPEHSNQLNMLHRRFLNHRYQISNENKNQSKIS